ncbi:hypothetical protein Hanom_Chr01g00083201 [Helianthus anomalus]
MYFVFRHFTLFVMSLFGFLVLIFMYIMVCLSLYCLCFCFVLLCLVTYLQILASLSWIGAHHGIQLGSLISLEIILRGVLLSFFSIFRVSHWGQCEVQVWGGG